MSRGDQWWDRWYLGMADYVATASKDPSSKIGAVIVRPDRTIASLGFNGFARGLDDSPHLYADRDFKIATVIHAEENALLSSRDQSHTGCTIYISGLPPCASCASKLIQAGIARVVSNDLVVPQRWAKNMRWGVENLLMAGVLIDVMAPYYLRSIRKVDDLHVESDPACDPSQVCGCAA